MLSPEQIAFFEANGYLLIRGALDPAGRRAARDLVWDHLPGSCKLRRDDPSTHIGPFPEVDCSDDPMHLREGFRWQLRRIGAHPLLLDLVYCETLVSAAESLLGAGTLRQPIVHGTPMGAYGAAWPGGPVDPALGTEGIRGIYCTLPYGEYEPAGVGCHTDGHPFHLGVVGLINDVPPGGGGFQVWPGSHKRLYPTFTLQYDQPRVPYYPHLPGFKGIVHTQAYKEELARVIEDTEPVDCCGEAGDVVLWHHRLAHAAGHNRSSVIREAVLSDFARTDLDSCRADPPQADMWRDWCDALARASHAPENGYSAAFALDQRLPA